MSEIIISKLQKEDATIVAELIRETILSLGYMAQSGRDFNAETFTAEFVEKSADQESKTYMIAKDGLRPIGFCIGFSMRGVYNLTWVGVAPGYRKQGVGYKLLSEFCQMVKNKGGHKIFCYVLSKNVESQGLFKKAGFDQVADLKNHWDHDDMIMLQKFL